MTSPAMPGKRAKFLTTRRNLLRPGVARYDTGARFTRASTAATAGVLKARDWIKENPGKTAVVTVSLVLGIRGGAAFPGLDAVLLGAHPHWLTHSALPVYGLRKASEKFDSYLKKREELIGRGELDEAEQAARGV